MIAVPGILHSPTLLRWVAPDKKGERAGKVKVLREQEKKRREKKDEAINTIMKKHDANMREENSMVRHDGGAHPHLNLMDPPAPLPLPTHVTAHCSSAILLQPPM